jgi:hypothetical protein
MPLPRNLLNVYDLGFSPYREDALDINSLVDYFEARFIVAMRTMASTRGSQLNALCKCLHQELVSIFNRLFFTLLSYTFR